MCQAIVGEVAPLEVQLDGAYRGLQVSEPLGLAPGHPRLVTTLAPLTTRTIGRRA